MKVEFEGLVIVVRYEIAVGTRHRQNAIVRILRARRNGLSRGGGSRRRRRVGVEAISVAYTSVIRHHPSSSASVGEPVAAV